MGLYSGWAAFPLGQPIFSGGKMKKILIGIALAVLASPMFGQTTAVSAVVVDSNGTDWVSSTCTATWVGTGKPIDLNGNPFNTSPTCTVDSSANLSVTVQDVAYIAPPASTWKFCVTPATSQPVTYCTSIPATGSTETITTQITAAIQPPNVTGGPLARAYADSEVQAIAGNQYYNLVSNQFRCYTSSWSGCAAAGGGGGSVSITSSTGDLTVSPSPLTGTGTIDLNLASANTWTGVQTFSSSNGAPALFTTASFVSTLMSSFLAPNLATGAVNSFHLGVANSSDNDAYLVFSNAGGSGSSSNFLELAINSQNGLNCYANGGCSVGEGSTSPTKPGTNGLLVVGPVQGPTFVGTVATGSGTSPAIAAGDRDFTITLTGATTATVSGITAGTDLNVEVCQSSGNSYVFTFPSAMHGVTSTTPSAGDCNTFLYHSFNGSTLELMASQTGLLP